jgi:hypothetical protein
VQTDLAAIQEIEQLKYRYWRYLDLKQFDELGLLLTEDATSAYQDGVHAFEGRAAIVQFLIDSLADPGIVTQHQGHHPEITLVSPTEATGVWYLFDRVVMPSADLEIGGTAFYEDRYVRTDDGWRIAHTGYRRVFEERRTHRTHDVQSFTSRF